jgi:hypothetical protein
LSDIQVNPELLPQIRASFTDEIAEKLGLMQPNQREVLQNALKKVGDEEERMARLYSPS